MVLLLLWSCFAQLIVIVDNIRTKKDKQPYPLLFWRACCDFGLAIRFVLTPGFNVLICGHLVCTRLNARKYLNSSVYVVTMISLRGGTLQFPVCYVSILYYCIRNLVLVQWFRLVLLRD